MHTTIAGNSFGSRRNGRLGRCRRRAVRPEQHPARPLLGDHHVAHPVDVDRRGRRLRGRRWHRGSRRTASTSVRPSAPAGRSPGSGHEIPVLVPLCPRGAPCVSAEDARGAPRPPASPSNPCTFGAVPARCRRARRRLARRRRRRRRRGPLPRRRGVRHVERRVHPARRRDGEPGPPVGRHASTSPPASGRSRLTTPHCNPLTDLNGRCADLDISRGDVTIRGDADRTTISATVGRIFDLSTNVTLQRPRPRRRAGRRRVRWRRPRARCTPPAGKQVTIGDSELHGGAEHRASAAAPSPSRATGTLDLHNVSLHDNGDPFGAGVGGALAVDSNGGCRAAWSASGPRATGRSSAARSPSGPAARCGSPTSS